MTREDNRQVRDLPVRILGNLRLRPITNCPEWSEQLSWRGRAKQGTKQMASAFHHGQTESGGWAHRF